MAMKQLLIHSVTCIFVIVIIQIIFFNLQLKPKLLNHAGLVSCPITTIGNDSAVDSICSLIKYLNIDNESFNINDFWFDWKTKQLIIGWLWKIYYKYLCVNTFDNNCDYGQHCPVINIHKFLLDNIQLSNDNYTIIINTWQRDKCLIKNIIHYLNCDNVAQIRVIWSDPKNDIPDILKNIQSMQAKNKLIFDEYKDNKLTNRFKYNSEWITDAIYQIDDDIQYSCNFMSNMFKLWQLFPLHMIVVDSRFIFKQFLSRNKTQTILNLKKSKRGFYRPIRRRQPGHCGYNMPLPTMGSFMHKKYYKMYSNNDINEKQNSWKYIKQYVDGNVTAEDITMTVMYLYYSKLPAISVVLNPSDFLLRFKVLGECVKKLSPVMHSNSENKRRNILLDTLSVLGYYDKNSSFNIPDSTLWIDVM
eukprot:298289_1